MDNIISLNQHYGYVISIENGNYYIDKKPFEYLYDIKNLTIEDYFNWHNLPGPYDEYGNKIEKRGLYFYKLNTRFAIMFFSKDGNAVEESNILATKFLNTYMDELKLDGSIHKKENIDVHADMLIIRTDMSLLTEQDISVINRMVSAIE